MRRSMLVMAGLFLAVLVLPANEVLGEVYEAPYYQAARPNCGPVPGGPCCDPCNCGSPATKLGRGVTNVLTGWIEIPKHTITGVFNANVTPLEGVGVGLARGFGRAIERTGIGAFEVLTFPIPGYYPLLCPEYISLESNCMAWRTANYCGGCCPMPSCMPCCPPPPPCGVGWGPPPMPRPDMARADMPQPDGRPLPPPPMMGRNTPPAPPTSAGSAGERAPGPVSYPDDYLK
jgi:putative exosortase-associated protein (TIGR04073 family)